MDKPLSKLEQQRANAEATRKAKNSRGGVESRHATDPDMRGTGSVVAATKAAIPVIRPSNSKAEGAGVAPGPRETKSKGGRPLAKDAHTALMQTKPWGDEGMSRTTWYRRQKEKAK
jgi:hypothetical protein